MKTIATLLLTLTLQISVMCNTLSNTNVKDTLNEQDTLINLTEIPTNDSINLYLLRGLTRESGHWGDYTINQIKKDLPKARIIFLDLPGAGKYVDSVSPSDIPTMVDFMRRDVKDLLKAKNGNNYIVATSLGGMLAYDWTIRYKDDFKGLIMITSTFKKVCKLTERVKLSAWKNMIKTIFVKDPHKRERLIVEIDSNRPEIYDSVTHEWGEIQRQRKMTRKNIIRQTLAGFKYAFKGIKPEVPVLVIGSKEDRMVCTTCMQKVSDSMGATLVWHENAGHGIPVDAPEWISDQVSIWINSTESNYLAENR